MSINNLSERQRLLSWLDRGDRSPDQLNELFEADCELLAFKDGTTIAVTTDSISEEIALGLYQDPYTSGYIAATASLSDLSAVGAAPLGLLLSACFASGVSDAFKARVSNGFADAARHAQTHVLGGDCSSGMQTVLTSTGLGFAKRPVQRIGVREGDCLVLSGKSGIGPALAYSNLLSIKDEHLEIMFRPSLSPDAKESFATHARAMIDTSDGILSAVATLCALNGAGVRLFWDERVLDERAIAFCQENKIPLWALWVAEHGDYQLLAAVGKEDASAVKGHVIGEFTQSGVFDLSYDDKTLIVDPSWGQLVAHTHPREYHARCKMLLDEFRERRFV